MAEDIGKLGELFKKLESEVKNKINRQLITTAANQIVTMMKKRVRDGLGVDGHGKDTKPFKPLRDDTILRRKQLQALGQLSKETEPEFSNQTETGKLVDSLGVTQNSDGLNIGILDPERQKVYEGQEEQGRPWLYLSKEEEEVLDKAILKELDDILKNL